MIRRHLFLTHAPWSLPGRIVITGGMRKLVPQEKRTYEYFGIVYVTSGCGWFEDATTPRMVVNQGDLLFLYPGVWHRYGPNPGGQWDEIFLVFTGSIFDSWRAAGWLPESPPVLSLENVPLWKRRIESVPGLCLPWNSRSCSEEVCRLQQLLFDAVAYRRETESRQDIDRRWMEEINDLLNASLVSPPDWDTLAAQVGMGYEAFRKRFVRVVGTSPAKYLMQLRINRGCNLLAHPAASNRSVAEQTGFCDEYYFSRCFKEIVGMTPREFRRQLWKIT